MKIIAVLSIVFLAVILNLLWMNSSQYSLGPHGGKVKQAENFNIEKIQSHENLYIFLLDHNYKPISNKGIVGEARFYFSDETTSDIPLKPFEADGFTVSMLDNNYHTCRITFTISGKSISTKFDNENLIVSTK